jgi:hypothetical protein
MEIPEELMHGPRLVVQDEDDSQLPEDERAGFLDSILSGRSRGARVFGGRAAAGSVGPRRLPPGGGLVVPPGAPRPGEAFRPSRDLAAKREAYYGTVPMPPSAPAVITRPVIPGERRYRDGDRVRHAAFGEGTVVSSKLTRDDEEVTVAFPDPKVGIKRLLASLANLEVLG